ncbi:MAG: chemotaxis protein CheW [candidate division Zixibacteria bacterium]|nr:chemotaxis protein CheW [candidate division Zixibacteria bacterium]
MAEENKQQHTDGIVQMVIFNLGQEEFGVNILNVQEINRMVEITQVPQSEHYVEGVINLRGKVIPIIDLRKKFGMPERERNNETRIGVVNINDETVGLIVDGVSEVLRIPVSSLEEAPKLISGETSSYSGAEYIKSIVKLEDRLLIYLDLTKIISSSVMPAA